MTAPDPAWVEAGYLMWCFSEGYGLPEDRVGENWLRESDERLHPDDVRQKAQLIALGRDLVAAVEPLIRREVLADLRAKVEGLPTHVVTLYDDAPYRELDRMAVLLQDVLALFDEEVPRG